MKPYQERVVTEKAGLDAKREALQAFVGSDQYQELEPAEHIRLSKQLWVMSLYSEILGERILAFT